MGSDRTRAAAKAPDGAWWLQSDTAVGTRTVVAKPAGKPRPAPVAHELPPHLPCRECGRANPADAYYCHFDGKPLFADLQQQPLHIGSLAFPSPFCFAGGLACANFNQLALGCNNLWDEARTLLTDGIWATFFTALGRLDIAAAAHQAAPQPDSDRALSQFLAQLPADRQFLRLPNLALGSSEIDLGTLTPGTDYTFDLLIENQGMLLLDGVAVSNFDWLVFSEPAKPLPLEREPVTARACAPLERPAAAEKYFQARLGCVIPVRIPGSKLRAGQKPLRGEIIVDTNGGALVVTVHASVPVQPFPRSADGNDVLAGVRSPRELAVKAKRFPTEAGRLFERGAVKAWYASNGWTYPIPGADGVGTGAVQQFFEVLGLTTPPRLEIDAPTLPCIGKTGETVTAVVTLYTRERKPVHAQAWTDQEWARPGPLQYLGTKVQIPVQITVPSQPGATAQAQLTIQGNGKQRFVVPITVMVKKR